MPTDEHRHDRREDADEEKFHLAGRSALKFRRPSRDENEHGDHHLKQILRQRDDELRPESMNLEADEKVKPVMKSDSRRLAGQIQPPRRPVIFLPTLTDAREVLLRNVGVNELDPSALFGGPE